MLMIGGPQSPSVDDHVDVVVSLLQDGRAVF